MLFKNFADRTGLGLKNFTVRSSQVTLVEKCTLDGARKVTLMKHKHIYVLVLAKVTRMDGVITIVII